MINKRKLQQQIRHDKREIANKLLERDYSLSAVADILQVTTTTIRVYKKEYIALKGSYKPQECGLNSVTFGTTINLQQHR